MGDSLDIKADPTYLGNRWQCVGVMQPNTGSPRVITKDGRWSGPQRRRGMVWWMKKRERNILDRSKREPFKLRFLKEEPVGAMLSLVEEGKPDIERTRVNGQGVMRVQLIKPKPWWKKML